MKPSRIITTLFGRPAIKSFASPEDIEALPKLKNPDGTESANLDQTKLPPETVGNVLLALMTNYAIQIPMDSPVLSYIAQKIVSAYPGDDIQLKETWKPVLERMIRAGTITESTVEGKLVKAGVYYAWCTQQVLDECGIVTEGFEAESV